MSSLNTIYMLRDVITGAFEHKVGKWQGFVGTDGEPTERKALLIFFRVKKDVVQMLIHAPANYVGVYTRKGSGKWKCLAYHDSCWRVDGVERFIFDHREDIQFIQFTFMVPPGIKILQNAECITDSIFVVKFSEEDLTELYLTQP